jgi:RecJ-like exonuclease
MTALVRAIGDRLFRASDAGARRYGWQVKIGHGGLSRTYRDPRFDLLQTCPACLGTGAIRQEQACGRCSGTGRITSAGKLNSGAGRGP